MILLITVCLQQHQVLTHPLSNSNVSLRLTNHTTVLLKESIPKTLNKDDCHKTVIC